MKIKATTEDARKLLVEGAIAMSEASLNGINVDLNYCLKKNRYLGIKIKKLHNKFEKSKTGGVWRRLYRKPNYNSDTQLRKVLFDEMKIQATKTTDKGNVSVDNESLELIKKEVPELEHYINFKKFSKLKNTYMGNILKEAVDGKLHNFFHLHTARTFRSSSSNINFQNQPNRDPIQKKIIRSAFIPTKGNRLGAFDFSGIEVGISCCNHKDPKMIKYVKDPKSDMHGDMTQQIFILDKFKKEAGEKKLRKGTKNGFVFPQFYGDYYRNNTPVLCTWADLPTKGSFDKKDGLKLMTGFYLGQHLINKGICNFDEFEDHIQYVEDDFWNKRFKVYKKWKERSVKKYYKKGYLKTLTGFTCSGMMRNNDINNYPIQGPAFHCLLKTFIEVNKRLKKYKFKTKLIGQIHDELVFDIYPPETKNLKEMVREVACEWLPKQWSWIIVPLEIEANIFEPDANWSTDAKVQVLKAA